MNRTVAGQHCREPLRNGLPCECCLPPGHDGDHWCYWCEIKWAKP